MKRRCHLIPVLGSGGVGKSTCAASIGLSLAQQGAKVAVITVDPARRLAQILGLQSLNNQSDRVFESNRGFMDALWLNQDGALTELARKSFKSNVSLDKIIDHRLFKIIESQLGGIEEYLGVEKVLELRASGVYDFCVLDTPPSSHGIDFLESPQHILRFFDESVLKYFIDKGNTSEKKQNLLKKIFSAGKEQAVELFKNFLGQGFILELADLLQQMKPVSDLLRVRAQEIEEWSRSPDCHFALISILEAYPLREAELIKNELRLRGFPEVELLVLNKALPMEPPSNWPDSEPIAEQLKKRHGGQKLNRDQLQKKAPIALENVELPRISADSISLSGLIELGTGVISPWTPLQKILKELSP